MSQLPAFIWSMAGESITQLLELLTAFILVCQMRGLVLRMAARKVTGKAGQVKETPADMPRRSARGSTPL